jgi:hypothetical protein
VKSQSLKLAKYLSVTIHRPDSLQSLINDRCTKLEMLLVLG